MSNRIEELRAASDADVDEIIIALENPGFKVKFHYHDGVPWCYDLIAEDVMDNVFTRPMKHFCIRWEDAGPLMIDNRIDLIHRRIKGGIEWAVAVGKTANNESFDYIDSENINPLRAIAETYIIMKWSEE